MEKEQGKPCLVALRLADARAIDLVAGSRIQECDLCHEPVYVFPSGQAWQRENSAGLICLPCFVSMEVSPAQVQDLTPEQLLEIKSVLGYSPTILTAANIMKAVKRRFE